MIEERFRSSTGGGSLQRPASPLRFQCEGHAFGRMSSRSSSCGHEALTVFSSRL
ncbi:hypothetical protein F2Q69_00037171 [Brassica cretica]|uniref:Uncharacterized protein n=1 Tax=Brassica cretica TaxID=69181 RepID=A0A8S9SPK6_BRACR|nr:hypothetical protein F2Q69_00037171 [Brassica cretica]